VADFALPKPKMPGRYRLHVRPGLIALCTGSVLVGAAALAEDSGSGQPHVGATVQADQGVEALLRQIERQISIGHTMTPEGDNALATWHRLLEVVSPTSLATRRVLTEFAADTRRRAAQATATGQPVVASDLLVFAGEATQLLQLQSIKSGSSSAAVPPPAPAAVVRDTPPSTLPTDIATRGAGSSETPNSSAQSIAPTEPRRGEIDQGQTGMSSAGLAGTGDSATSAALNKEAMTPIPVASNTGAASAVLTPHPSVTTRTPQEQAAAAAFAGRGDAMLAIKDISAARVFYEYAANAGSARAAMALAKTYDAAFLNQLGAVGPRPNPAMAADWYRKAAALGDRGAEAWLRAPGTAAPSVHE
jgi:TPR repeat protein